MRLYWKMLLPGTMMSPQFTGLASATGSHNLQKGLPPYADRSDLLGHHMFEQSRRLSLTATVAICLDSYHEFIKCQPLSGFGSGALSIYRRG
jgi:hypothetical protein